MNDEMREAEIDDVRGKIRYAATNRDTLTLLFVRLLELSRPEWRFEMTSENELKVVRPDGESSSIFLLNFWIECEQSPEERLEIVERRIRILATDEAKSEGIRLEQVVALVRDATYREYVPEDDRDLVTAHLAADIWIIYACDLPDAIDVLTKEEVASLNLDSEKLRKISIANLAGMMTQIEAEPHRDIHVISCENVSYASSLLLIDAVWEQLGPLVKGDIVAGVPARDTLIFAGSEDAAALATLREEVNYVIENGHHLISESLLRRVGDRWEIFS